MILQSQHLYEFGPFRLDPKKRLLMRDCEIVPLMPKAYDTLLALLENGEHVVEKDALMKRIWPDSFVEEANLTNNISAVRKALGEKVGEHQYVVTIPGRGYRFVAKVREVPVVSEVPTSVAKTWSGNAWETEFAPDRVEPKPDSSGDTGKRTTRRWELSLLAGLILSAPILAAAYLFIFERSKSVVTTRVTSIAVLPFKSLGPESDDQYLELGMADTLITKLSNISQIIVRPTSVIRKYDDEDRDPLAAGREQQVDAVLDGNIQKAEGRIRVTLRLYRVPDGASLWTDTLDENDEDIFKLQDAIAERLVDALTVTLTGEERALLTKRHTENTEAYRLYRVGRYWLNKRSEEGFKKAIESFDQAIVKDPNYALAYAGLADCYTLLGFTPFGGLAPRETMPRAKEAAMQALKLDDSLAEAHTSLALVALNYDWDWPVAEREFKRAIELNPTYPAVHDWYAEYPLVMGDAEEALRERELAQQLDPLSLVIRTKVGMQFYLTGDYEEARKRLSNVLEMDQNFFPAHAFLGSVYLQERNYESALKEFQEVRDLSQDGPWAVGWLGYAYAVSGKRDKAMKALSDLKQMSEQRYVSPTHAALIHIGLGDKDKAFELLEKAYEERSSRLLYLKIDPLFDTLRSDPRFADLVRRVGLPQ